jgi:hypothetical protein
MMKIFEQKKTKRWFNAFVAFVLAVSLFPIMSNAYGEDSEIERPAVSYQEQTIPELVSPDQEETNDESVDTNDGSEVEASNEENGSDEQGSGTDLDQSALAAAAMITTAADPTWVTASNGATVTFQSDKSATVTGNGAIVVDLEKDKGNTYTLTINGNVKGTIDVGAKTTLNLKGAGSLTGTGDRSVVLVRGKQALLNLNKDDKNAAGEQNNLTITGGKGTPTNIRYPLAKGDKAGGAIHVSRADASEQTVSENAKLYMEGGRITGNTADAGGGIFIDRYCQFEMKGGEIAHNIANVHEGGGLYIAGPNTSISAGNIHDNTTKTTTDWGGGGIFVEVQGKLTINTVTIYDNTAQGLGGGVSGCPHAFVGIGSFTQGAAIYGNHATMQRNPDNQALYALASDNRTIADKIGTTNEARVANEVATYPKNGLTVSGDVYAFSSTFAREAFEQNNAAKAQDFYCTRSSIVFGQTVSGMVDPTKNAWVGVYAGPDAKKGAEVEITEGSVWSEKDYTLGLSATANPSSVPQRALMITGNTSYTHGGGIGCNGQLVIGSLESKTVSNYGFTLEFEKKLKGVNGNDILTQTGARFDFALYGADAQGTVDESKVVATATSDENGKIVFEVRDKAYVESGTYTFFAKEIGRHGTDLPGDITLDERYHKVTVQIVKTTSTAVVDGYSVTTNNSLVVENGITYGDESKGEGKVFTNQVNPSSGEDFITDPWTLEFTKSFKSLNDQNLFEIDADKLASMGIDRTFTFELYGAKTETVDGKEMLIPNLDEKLATTTNDGQGKVTFQFLDNDSIVLGNNEGMVDAKKYRSEKEGEQTYTFFVKESVADTDRHPAIDYEALWHKVSVTVGTKKSQRMDDPDSLTPKQVDVYTSSVMAIEYLKETEPADGKGSFEKQEGSTFVNIYHPEGTLDLVATKYFYGNTAPDKDAFGFTMVNILAPEDGVVNLNESPRDLLVYHAGNEAFAEDATSAEVIFEDIPFTMTGDDYWFMISEDEASGVSIDPRVYVIRVVVDFASDGMTLVPHVTELYYAEGITETPGIFGSTSTLELTRINEVNGKLPTIEFANFDNGLQTMSLYGYAINAASNEPIDQECFVDPKIIKNLDGRSLTEGEFNFKLIELTSGADGAVDWANTQGPTISETSNDRYGMVDFDKANNVSGDWENPSCLAYTAPGTYYYRVVEANDSTDPSVNYSQQIITFTTVIELNAQGQLECTDMYYGHVEDGENVRYAESEDPQWHPTMTNTARGMDLQVRKTSDLDRDQGLEGATYGLYALNNAEQADIFLQEAISDADGWIIFEDVSLTEGTLYYFKERLAPAGHTVSEFRSAYFYLVKDSTAPNGYALHYTDSKTQLGSAEALPEPAALTAMAENDDMPTALDEQTSEVLRSDDGDLLFTFTRDGGVHDEATLVEFAKLDTRTHEWVEGANLSIIEKDTGKEVNRWISGQAVEKLEGKLNVDTTYILRENSAPEGYAKAEEVEFTIDQYGAVRIISGTSNGNAEIQDSTITLYDTMLDGEEVVSEYREISEEEGGLLAKTGDFLKIAGIVALALIALFALVAAACRMRKNKNARMRH